VPTIRHRALRNRLTRAAIGAALSVEESTDIVRLGSDYGGWWVPEELIPDGSIAYCAGVGTDITFDLALIELFGCEVWAFDPTPRVIEWVAEQSTPPQWHFEPVGLWDRADTIRFYLPANPEHGSLSATNAQGTDHYIDAPVEPLDAIMRRLDHTRIDLLKMDIEGAEGRVLDAMLVAGIKPTVLCVEFDEPETPWRVVRRVRDILAAGYVLNKVDLWNYTFSMAG
jgi:FkbM family methyltransferase